MDLTLDLTLEKPWHGVTVLTKLIERKQMGRRHLAWLSGPHPQRKMCLWQCKNTQAENKKFSSLTRVDPNTVDRQTIYFAVITSN